MQPIYIQYLGYRHKILSPINDTQRPFIGLFAFNTYRFFSLAFAESNKLKAATLVAKNSYCKRSQQLLHWTNRTTATSSEMKIRLRTKKEVLRANTGRAEVLQWL